MVFTGEKSELEQIATCFLPQIPLSSGDTILLAVSGGLDSMVLLSVFYNLYKNQRKGEDIPEFSLAVAHFNHESRGEESEKDARLVEEQVKHLSKENSIPFYLGRGNINQLAQEQKKGFEETARLARYDFFQSIADQIEEQTGKNCYIATAHHGKDNIETFLLHFSRGAGLQGLSGIHPQRGRIIRPFLEITPKELKKYQETNKIPFREDLSNQDEVYRRNFVRHQMLDKMESLNPKYLEHSINTIRIIREENELLNQLVEEKIKIEKIEHGFSMDIPSLLAQKTVLQQRAMQYVTQLLQPQCSLTAKHRNQLLHLAKREQPQGEISITSLLHIYRNYDKMIWYFGEVSPLQGVGKALAPQILLEQGKEISWNTWLLSLHSAPFTGTVQENQIWFSVDVPVFVRSRKVGDKLKLLHRPRKTVKKWCIEEKIPEKKREVLPVLVTQQEEVIAVFGLGVDCAYLPVLGEVSQYIQLKERERGT